MNNISTILFHGLFSSMILFSSWFFTCKIIDFTSRFNYIKESKLQSYQKTDDINLKLLAKNVVTRNWTIIILSIIFFSPVLRFLFPFSFQMNRKISYFEMIKFFIIWFISNDFLFTIFHKKFHENKFLYKHVHKLHHKWTSPFAWMSHAMSLYELLANSIASMAYPIFYSLFLKRDLPMEMILLIQIISQIIGCIEHSGYNNLYPLVIINPNYFPKWLFSSTKHHDDHHRYFKGNYGGYLAIWDYLMNTNIVNKEKNIK